MRETDFCHNKLYSDNKQPPPPQQRTGVVVWGGGGYSWDRLMAKLSPNARAGLAAIFAPIFAATRRDAPRPPRPQTARKCAQSIARVPDIFSRQNARQLFFLGAKNFGKNLPRQHFFLMIFLRKHLSKNVLLCAPPGSPEFVSLKKHADSGTSFFHWGV